VKGRKGRAMGGLQSAAPALRRTFPPPRASARGYLHQHRTGPLARQLRAGYISDPLRWQPRRGGYPRKLSSRERQDGQNKNACKYCSGEVAEWLKAAVC
jgi:hypothetical protein